ncbi:NaeI family type II restriction endonuclease [Actinospongicola halichondriae]|uniref:NaeI family type II restriction endonuclease n=1 Tax=Actinospongicola halichondriae TaxID=3236844 RepID=UPI003D48A52A
MLDDAALGRAVDWFLTQPDMAQRFAGAIRQSFDEVFDGQRTGRYSLDQLSKVEKTYIGTKVEIVVQAEFGLQRGQRMDYLVAGEEVDAKWSMRSGGWMIPTEAVGELCLCMTADDSRSVFSVGLVRANEDRLRTSKNQDKKRRLNDNGVTALRWLEENGKLDENLLLHLDNATRSAILDYGLSGQRRVNQLFRLVQRRAVRREVVLTVAQQDDGPKRVRDARKHLQPEGIVLLGHQGSHPRLADAWGLTTPPKGSWIAVRVAPSPGPGPGVAEIADSFWRVATNADPIRPGPRRYQ